MLVQNHPIVLKKLKNELLSLLGQMHLKWSCHRRGKWDQHEHFIHFNSPGWQNVTFVAGTWRRNASSEGTVRSPGKQWIVSYREKSHTILSTEVSKLDSCNEKQDAWRCVLWWVNAAPSFSESQGGSYAKTWWERTKRRRAEKMRVAGQMCQYRHEALKRGFCRPWMVEITEREAEE